MNKQIRSILKYAGAGMLVGVLFLGITIVRNPPREYDNSSAAPSPKTMKELAGKAQLIFTGEIGPIIQQGTFAGYGAKGELLDGVAVGRAYANIPFTDFEVKIDRSFKDDGTIAKGKSIILRMGGDATQEMKSLTANTDYPFSFTGDHHLFLLTLNPDGVTYGFYYGPWSRLLVKGTTLHISNSRQEELKLDGNDKAIQLDEFAQSITAR